MTTQIPLLVWTLIGLSGAGAILGTLSILAARLEREIEEHDLCLSVERLKKQQREWLAALRRGEQVRLTPRRPAPSQAA